MVQGPWRGSIRARRACTQRLVRRPPVGSWRRFRMATTRRKCWISSAARLAAASTELEVVRIPAGERQGVLRHLLLADGVVGEEDREVGGGEAGPVRRGRHQQREVARDLVVA